jgi:hypothetical protein
MTSEEDMIYPTHKAFDDALEFLDEMAMQKNPLLFSGRFKLVHAIVGAPGGRDSAQAWVEENEQYVIFAGILNGVKRYFIANRKEFYDDINVKETTKYTVEQAIEQNLLHKTFGPWVKRYQELCGRAPEDEWPGATVRSNEKGLGSGET